MPKNHPNPKNHAMACSSEEKAYQSSSLKTVAKEQESFFDLNSLVAFSSLSPEQQDAS